MSAAVRIEGLSEALEAELAAHSLSGKLKAQCEVAAEAFGIAKERRADLVKRAALGEAVTAAASVKCEVAIRDAEVALAVLRDALVGAEAAEDEATRAVNGVLGEEARRRQRVAVEAERAAEKKRREAEQAFVAAGEAVRRAGFVVAGNLRHSFASEVEAHSVAR